MSLRRRLLDFLRVPVEPRAPEGDGDVRIFRAAPNYFWYRLLHWAVKNGFGLIGILGALGMTKLLAAITPSSIDLLGIDFSRGTLLILFTILEFGAVAAFIAQAIGSLILLRLDFEQRWYIVTDRSLRIREGLLRLREQTVTYANVQQVSIRQGPLMRLLGIADLEVRTAGGKGDELGEQRQLNPHLAQFRGIANPETMRQAIRDRLRQHRDAGLGDPDDPPPAPELLGAALDLAHEARSFRLAMAGGVKSKE